MKIINKEEDIKKFNESEIGKIKNAYFKRSTIIGILLIMLGLIWLILSFYLELELLDFIMSPTVTLFGIYFIIKSNRLRKIEINKFANKSSK